MSTRSQQLQLDTKTDNPTLADCVHRCFNLALDGRLSQAQNNQFGQLGEDLRGKLVVLLSKTFDVGTPAMIEANKKIAAVNKQLKKVATDLAEFANTIEQLGNLVAALNTLLAIPLGL